MDASKLSKRALKKLEQKTYEEKKSALLMKKRKRKIRKEKKELEQLNVIKDQNVVELLSANEQQTSSDTQKKLLKREREVENKIWKRFDRNSEDPNSYFTEYYKPLLQIDDAEWKVFMKSISKNLLVTFRLNYGRHPLITQSLTKRLDTEFKFHGTFVKVGDRILSSSEVVNRFPRVQHVWQLGLDRLSFSKAKALEPLYDTIDREAKLGHLTRQGVASMIPAVVLKPKRGEILLDMCAAPGSKSEQLLQMVGSDSEGLIITNDSDPSRLKSLMKRFSKFGQRNHVITCSRGEDLYNILGADLFDGIICDVPCSGDGTIRKYPHILKRWRPRQGAALHELQLQLAMSSASLLTVGGRMVYSTCSINPIEDEAVVNALLEASNGALKLVEISNLEGFVVRPGLTTWPCDEATINKRDESQPKRKKNKGRQKFCPVVPTMLPNPGRHELQKCIRILHHDNDTEGFFVALIEKQSPWEAGKDGALQSAAKSNEVLQEAGFNPKTFSSQLLKPVEHIPMTPTLERALVSQLGLSDELIDLVKLSRAGGGDELSLSLLSTAAEAFVDEAKVPVLHAGVCVATTVGVFKRNRLVETSGLVPCPHGGLELLAAIPEGSTLRVESIDVKTHFEMLQLIAALESSDVELDDLIDVLLPEENDDEEDEGEVTVNNPVARRLIKMDVGTCVYVVLKNGQVVITDEKKDGTTVPNKKESKKLSIAERKRLKKQKRRGGGLGKNPTTMVESSEKPEQQKKSIEMFGNTIQDEAVFPILLQRVSPKKFKVLTDDDRITSYGQALESLLCC